MNDVTNSTPRYDPSRELGEAALAQGQSYPGVTDDLARTFMARVQRDIDEQVDLRVRQQLGSGKAKSQSSGATNYTELTLGSLGIGVGMTAVAGFSHIGAAVAIVGWVAIVLINLMWALAFALKN